MGANASTAVPLYASGQVLDAARLNLTNAGVPVFSGTATRDAAFGGSGQKVLAEGQLCYLEDTNAVQYYDSAAWQAVGAEPVWQAWTPTLTNLTAGNGTTVARYYQDGKLVVGYFLFTFGTTSSISGSVSVSLPVNMSTSYPQTRVVPIGTANFEDDGTQTYFGVTGGYRDLQRFFVFVYNASATYVTQSTTSSTVPFTWGNLDAIFVNFVYEAA